VSGAKTLRLKMPAARFCGPFSSLKSKVERRRKVKRVGRILTFELAPPLDLDAWFRHRQKNNVPGGARKKLRNFRRDGRGRESGALRFKTRGGR
jgi:hypothetical protein